MNELETMKVIERTGSTFSLLGFAIIASTYLAFPSFKRKLFNKLVFFASFGNMGANIATMISTDAIEAGDYHNLCKSQAFLIQWLMPADALWAFCMALNVFFAFNTTRLKCDLKRLGVYYLIGCYGIPFVPALTYLILDYRFNGHYYGNAELWCWISNKHKTLRIITFYGPVWFFILLIAALYIFNWRAVHRAQVKNHNFEAELCSEHSQDSSPNAGGIFKTTTVSHEQELGSLRHQSQEGQSSRCYTYQVQQPAPVRTKQIKVVRGPIANQPTVAVFGKPSGPPPSSKLPMESSPSSPRSSASRLIRSRPSHLTTTVDTSPAIDIPSSRTNRGAQVYALVAFVVFVALLIVWVPATTNRALGLHGGSSDVLMNLIAAAVLPLQGFFNCLVYLFFSRNEVRKEYSRLTAWLFKSFDALKLKSTRLNMDTDIEMGSDVEKGTMNASKMSSPNTFGTQNNAHREVASANKNPFVEVDDSSLSCAE